MQKIHGRPNNTVIFQYMFGWGRNNRDQKRVPRISFKAIMSSSSGKSLELRDSNTNYAYEESSNMRIREENYGSEKLVITQLIKPIEQRLSILEEEYEVLKEGALSSMEERTVLMDEIFKEFETTHNHLRLINQEREHCSFNEVLASIQALKKERRPGLLQVLWQETNPSLISRYAKARAVAVQGPAKYAHW